MYKDISRIEEMVSMYLVLDEEDQLEIQEKVFKALGLGEEEVQTKFGFLVNAFRYGTPPHAGLAIGLDRLIALMAGTDSIRDVIAFPKNSSAKCLMTGAPAEVGEDQLRELHLRSTVKLR